MGLLSIFTAHIRRAVSEAVRLGITDGVKAALGDSAPNTAEADEEEQAVRLLLLPAPEEKPKGRKAQ